MGTLSWTPYEDYEPPLAECETCGREIDMAARWCPRCGSYQLGTDDSVSLGGPDCGPGKKRCSCGASLDLPENRVHCTSHHVNEELPGLYDDPAWDIWCGCGGCGHVFRNEWELANAAGVKTADVESVKACPYCGHLFEEDVT
jgi:uncharacterized C2H2 Zn-finger protein